MEGDIILMAHSEDGTTVLMCFYSRLVGKMLVVVSHYDPVAEDYSEDMDRHFETPSRAKAEERFAGLMREYDISEYEELMFMTVPISPDAYKGSIWDNRALPYLN